MSKSGAAYVAAFEKACRQGNSSMFGTGLNPGFVIEKIAAAATGICTEVRSIFVREVFDAIGIPDSDYLFNVLEMGSDPAKLDLTICGPVAELITGMYSEVIALMDYRWE